MPSFNTNTNTNNAFSVSEATLTVAGRRMLQLNILHHQTGHSHCVVLPWDAWLNFISHLTNPQQRDDYAPVRQSRARLRVRLAAGSSDRLPVSLDGNWRPGRAERDARRANPQPHDSYDESGGDGDSADEGIEGSGRRRRWPRAPRGTRPEPLNDMIGSHRVTRGGGSDDHLFDNIPGLFSADDLEDQRAQRARLDSGGATRRRRSQRPIPRELLQESIDDFAAEMRDLVNFEVGLEELILIGVDPEADAGSQNPELVDES